MLGEKELAKYIDHTLLAATASPEELEQLCNEARQWGFYSVCVHPSRLEFCKKRLENTDVKLCTVVGFPLGQNSTATKVFEAKNAIEKGADELDMVLNISALKEGDDEYVRSEISQIVETAGPILVKVIIESCLLSKDEIIKATKICEKSQAAFVKTSTGFSTEGATIESVETILSAKATEIKVKASGGIRNTATAIQYIELGVDRLGTSKSVEIIQGLK